MHAVDKWSRNRWMISPESGQRRSIDPCVEIGVKSLRIKTDVDWVKTASKIGKGNACMDNCIFCKIAGKELSSEVVYENDEVLAFRDVAPVAPVHILVIPKKHVPALEDLKAEDRKILLPNIFDAIDELAKQEGLAESGYRVVNNSGREGGQTVNHLHFHLLGGRSMQWPPG